ncbi:methyltransferase domain-containing protein [Streptomyces sp. N2-109]|uniref:Methyltransferase domain-containing protein n=1 Tax=Streptomyces gossypii TaxID=2883101 RepID=A0ABT2K1D4_9ACTN|nr:methyltransferase domain-containing protein [Streptomyces gossypii]MCT2593274.1 methyltransferase domain-containing protein [Streptomyces gossypii]
MVARQLDEQLASHFGPDHTLRVLDAGFGRGAQALRLARAGHRVTGLEPDPALRSLAADSLAGEDAGVRARVRIVAGGGGDTGAHFLPGAFDLVLCHGVLTEARDPASTLAGLARVLAPGGLLSLLVRNDAALALQAARGGDWEAALSAFDFPERAFLLDSLSTVLSGIGTPLTEWYGVQVLTTGSATPADDARLIAAEERAGRTDPYRSVAALLHLCAVRG